MFSEADRAYVQAGYFTLEELCVDRAETPAQVEQLIADGVLPAASYVIDGEGMFPADYFVLVDQAGGAAAVCSAFAERYRAVGGDPANVEEDWDGYVSGLF